MSKPSVRPKRAGEDFARTHHGLGADDDDFDGPSSSKKPRFDLRNPSSLAPDALEEDAILDADEIGRGRRGVRRNAVNIDGYESDSENEGFDARAEAKAKANREQQKKEQQDDDDMFAELKEDFEAEEMDEDEAARKKKKSVRFLRDDEIEGQVASSRGGHSVRADLSRPDVVEDDESESESDVPDEERARLDEGMDAELGAGAKKTHAPLLDAFNMRAEQEEGRFDEEGNYIRKAADPDAIHDTWLEGVSKKDIRRAREAAERRDAQRREKDRQNDSILTADLLRTLIIHLQRGETVLEALARLGKGLRKKPKWQTKHRNKPKSKMTNGRDSNGAVEDVEMTDDDPEEAARKQAIDAITGAADLLLTRGQTDIYEVEREMLTRQYRRETGEEWIDPPQADNGEDTGLNTEASGTTMWEYRWSDARDGGQTHGPYDSTMMKSWSDAGYFGEGVEFRRAGDPTSEWTRVAAFT
ncbi:hypothetical protein VTN77DRAFT_1538 [Rasamsonia byssochlamydoides]|uniref:uncharacterized protein n=1 Tax=Rasamsonia byssochlamydoides TaxID=89139 RepID=UPI0037423DE7